MKVNTYFSRKFHSLMGVIPLGAFLIMHLISNYEAFNSGPQGFADQVAWINSIPLVLFFEIFLIWLPLLYHGVYGLYVAYQARNNFTNYSYFRNQMFFWQRITGVIAFVFIIWHFYDTRFQVTLGNVTHENLGTLMHEMLINPIYFTLYCIGIVATSFHFSNGMWNFLVSWGITVGPRAQRISGFIWAGVFVVMSIMFVLALSAFTDQSFAATVNEAVLTKIG